MSGAELGEGHLSALCVLDCCRGKAPYVAGFVLLTVAAVREQGEGD